VTFAPGPPRIQLSRATAPHGKITFLVVAGLADRQFVILSTKRSPSGLPLSGSVVNLSKSGAILTSDKVRRRRSAYVTVTLPAGRYLLLSNSPGDYQAGYRAVFRVR
jgi:hypothetical protein